MPTQPLSDTSACESGSAIAVAGRRASAIRGQVSWRSARAALATSFAVAASLIGASNAAAIPPPAPNPTEFTLWATSPGAQTVNGDFDGDGFGDIALTGGPKWKTIPIAFSQGNGKFIVTNPTVADIPGLAQAAGTKAVSGDFNGDGRDDIALVGASSVLISIALSTGEGRFTLRTGRLPEFPRLAQAPGVKVVTGDFNKDGLDDIALTGGPDWTGIPIAFSLGHGSFRFGSAEVLDFPRLAQEPGVKAIPGDFNKDGFGDIALTGGPGWTGIPIASSLGDGRFGGVTTIGSDYFVDSGFPGFAQAPGVTVVPGDFDKDGFGDIALTGGPGWESIPVARNYGNGQFTVMNKPVLHFASFAQAPGVKVVPGDFNKDGFGDIALTGGPGWTTIPVAHSYGNGQFLVTNAPLADPR
jgi:hypothetical protein